MPQGDTMEPDERGMPSGWACFLFGARTPDEGICWRPSRAALPNAFQRWCMRVFLACRWVRER